MSPLKVVNEGKKVVNDASFTVFEEGGVVVFLSPEGSKK